MRGLWPISKKKKILQFNGSILPKFQKLFKKMAFASTLAQVVALALSWIALSDGHVNLIYPKPRGLALDFLGKCWTIDKT